MQVQRFWGDALAYDLDDGEALFDQIDPGAGEALARAARSFQTTGAGHYVVVPRPPLAYLNADQRGGTTDNGKTSSTVDQAAAQLTRDGSSWNAFGVLGQAATVTFAFRATMPGTGMPDDTGVFSQFTTAQINAKDVLDPDYDRTISLAGVTLRANAEYVVTINGTNFKVTTGPSIAGYSLADLADDLASAINGTHGGITGTSRTGAGAGGQVRTTGLKKSAKGR